MKTFEICGLKHVLYLCAYKTFETCTCSTCHNIFVVIELLIIGKMGDVKLIVFKCLEISCSFWMNQKEMCNT